MIAFDASFLVDYLDGEPDTEAFIEANRGRPFFAPAPVLFELYRGGARTEGRAGVERVREALDWLEPIPFDGDAAMEAALVEADLLDAGDPVNLGDVLIAGLCRHHGATLVTADAHFDRVPGLDVERYR